MTPLWFGTLALAGIRLIARQPAILKGLSPTYALSFLVDEWWVALVAMGAVVLAVTGAEALYADMGHFGISGGVLPDKSGLRGDHRGGARVHDHRRATTRGGRTD